MELTVQDSKNIFPTKSEWATMGEMAVVLLSSGMLPSAVNTKEKAVAIMLKGRELNVTPWTALTKIHVIQGTPTVAPELMLALIKRSGLLEDMVAKTTDTEAYVMMKRRGESPHEVRFSIDDAKRMGLSNKENWKKQPKVMLQWRAVSACARMVFPDVVTGLYIHEEVNPDLKVDEMGEPVGAIDAVVEEAFDNDHTLPPEHTVTGSGDTRTNYLEAVEAVIEGRDDVDPVDEFYGGDSEQAAWPTAVEELQGRFDALYKQYEHVMKNKRERESRDPSEDVIKKLRQQCAIEFSNTGITDSDVRHELQGHIVGVPSMKQMNWAQLAALQQVLKDNRQLVREVYDYVKPLIFPDIEEVEEVPLPGGTQDQMFPTQQVDTTYVG